MKNKRYTAKITLLFIHRVIHVESTGWLGITELCILDCGKAILHECTAKISRRRGYYYAAF